jgi:hypothetical protein
VSGPRYKQADPRWSAGVLGFGPSTIGRAGCMLVCLCEAARMLRGVEMPPPLLNSAGVDRKAFLHSSALTKELGALAGLVVGDKLTAAEPSLLRGVIGEALRNGGLAIAHVDHTGDAFGDHFVLLHAERHDASGFKRIVYADPATGRDAELDAVSLTGSTVWGSRPKTYRVTSVRSVHAAQ